MGRSQTNDILNYLRENKTITSYEAFKRFGATRLSSIIFGLRKRGFVIETELANVVNRYGKQKQIAVYRLIKDLEV